MFFKNNKALIISLSISILLSSCGGNKNEQIFNSGSTSTGKIAVRVQHKNIKKAPIVNKLLTAAITKPKTIDDIKTLSDLIEFSPSLSNHPKKDAPGFFEMQKKQMQLDLEVGKARQNPEYIKTQNKIQDIRLAKTIWTLEMKALDDKITQMMKTTGSGSLTINNNMELSNLMKQRSTLFSEFYKTQEYKDDLLKNKDTLTKLYADMKNIQTPEIIKLQKEVAELGKKVYSYSGSISK